MAAKTTGNTVKRAGSKARPSSKPLRATSKTAAILNRLRSKQRKTLRKLKPKIEKQRALLLRARLDYEAALNLGLANAQRLSRLEFVCRQLIRPEWRQLMQLAAAKFPDEYPASLNGCGSPNESAPD